MFQNRVNLYNPIGVEGDFASSNPRSVVLAGPGGLVAGASGVTVGKFAWVEPSTESDTDGSIVNNYGSGPVTGFVHRDQQGLITNYLQESSLMVPTGFMVTLHNGGDFFAKNMGPNPSVPGQPVYARYSDGAVFTGSAPAGATATGSIGSTFTATGAGLDLTVTAVTGLISIGDYIAGTGVTAGTTITGQVSGTTGGAGVYTTSIATTVAGTTVTSFGDVLDVTAVATGILAVGDAITGTGVPAGAFIASQVSGAIGGVGVYTISVPATAYAASTALTVAGGVQTSFTTASVAAVGELVKISSAAV